MVKRTNSRKQGATAAPRTQDDLRKFLGQKSVERAQKEEDGPSSPLPDFPSINQEIGEPSSEAVQAWEADISRAYLTMSFGPMHFRLESFGDLASGLYHALVPGRSLPAPEFGSKAAKEIFIREISVLFLRRYGEVLWPEASQPAPHLVNRDLIYSRDSHMDGATKKKFIELGLAPPALHSFADISKSSLGLKMACFYRLLLDCPYGKNVDPDWDLFHFVLGAKLQGPEIIQVADQLPQRLLDQFKAYVAVLSSQEGGEMTAAAEETCAQTKKILDNIPLAREKTATESEQSPQSETIKTDKTLQTAAAKSPAGDDARSSGKTSQSGKTKQPTGIPSNVSTPQPDQAALKAEFDSLDSSSESEGESTVENGNRLSEDSLEQQEMPECIEYATTYRSVETPYVVSGNDLRANLKPIKGSSPSALQGASASGTPRCGIPEPGSKSEAQISSWKAECHIGESLQDGKSMAGVIREETKKNRETALATSNKVNAAANAKEPSPLKVGPVCQQVATSDVEAILGKDELTGDDKQMLRSGHADLVRSMQTALGKLHGLSKAGTPPKSISSSQRALTSEAAASSPDYHRDLAVMTEVALAYVSSGNPAAPPLSEAGSALVRDTLDYVAGVAGTAKDGSAVTTAQDSSTALLDVAALLRGVKWDNPAGITPNMTAETQSEKGPDPHNIKGLAALVKACHIRDQVIIPLESPGHAPSEHEPLLERAMRHGFDMMSDVNHSLPERTTTKPQPESAGHAVVSDPSSTLEQDMSDDMPITPEQAEIKILAVMASAPPAETRSKLSSASTQGKKEDTSASTTSFDCQNPARVPAALPAISDALRSPKPPSYGS